ncbi:MAG TPA: sialate O-acetylesterase, partial [Gemmatimonadaceae bacterium]|nr:sialate O-acetylesterase [Gemmatimonadaceae bacterium]
LWESAGYPGMDGIAWYRLSFTLSPEEPTRSARLSLGPIDDNDITWVNGIEVGRTTGYATPRIYTIPASALREGRNVLTVRVSDGTGGGGIYGKPEQLYLELGDRRPLAGTWKFKVGEVAVRADGRRVNKIPTVLYNRMVHPLQRFPIKGVLWYQGESNANNVEQAAAYRSLFEKLITSWRREWVGGKDFPFIWVQLPNFNPADSVPPTRSAWATQRASMTAALALPNTGHAITIDIGDANDIHPRNKQDVGARLALVARKVAYRQSVVASGPTYRRHTVRAGRVSIEFDDIGGGLVSRGPNGTVGGFAIAGADRKLVWAEARIDGDRVVVWSDRVPSPVAVRYAWADNPSTANLYNREGLPAAPFRTDTWQ